MSKEEEESPVISNSTEVCFTRFQIKKNFCILCAGFFIFLNAYDGLHMLQSTMNHEKGAGVISQTIYMVFFCISSLMCPKYIISKFGCKLTMIVSLCLFLPFVVANLYPKMSLLLITSIINGIAGPLLWSSQCQYLNEMAFLYTSISRKTKDKSLENFCTTQEESNTVVTDKNCNGSTYAEVKSNASFLKLSDSKNHQKLPEENNKNSAPSTAKFSYSPKQRESFTEEGIKPIYTEKDSQQSKEGDIYKVGAPQKLCNNISIPSNDQDNVLNFLRTEANEKTDGIAVSPHTVVSITARFFGIFGMFQLSPRMFSNFLSYFILQKGTSVIDFLNSTCTCGAEFCNVKSDCFMKNLHVPNTDNRNLFIGLCIGLSVSAIVLLALFLDPLNDRQRKTKFSLRLFSATFDLLKQKNLILLIPICMYIGLIEGFFVGDFTMVS